MNGATVLVVDDEALVRDVVAQMLRRAGPSWSRCSTAGGSCRRSGIPGKEKKTGIDTGRRR
jgi:CheY-like chemotaxis protein